jgi:hypothetical protein
MKKIKLSKSFLYIVTIIVIGFCIPQNLRMPVEGAAKSSYNQQSFWYYPWGKSVTHKGVDIFAKNGTKVFSATNGIVLFQGEIPIGGKIIFILGPKWRLHYCAHLEKTTVHVLNFVNHQTIRKKNLIELLVPQLSRLKLLIRHYSSTVSRHI